MELIRYLQIIYRRWWLIAALLLVVGVVSLVTFDWSPATVFTTSFRVNVGLEPKPPQGVPYEYNPFDVWRTSEYFMDDLASAIRGADYARRVADRLVTNRRRRGARQALLAANQRRVGPRSRHRQQLTLLSNNESL